MKKEVFKCGKRLDPRDKTGKKVPVKPESATAADKVETDKGNK